MNMTNFKGFTDSETFTQLPDSFFYHLLNEIEDTAELKVTLYMLWRIAHIESAFRALCETDFIPKDVGLSADEVRRGLEKSIQRGSILKRRHERSVEGSAYEADVFYFLNSPRGRAAADAFAKGQWRESARILSAPPVERPNVFKLYEENIGPLTPLIADMLKDAESLYDPEWIAEALIIAVKNNKRSWKYVEAILKRWKEEGRNGQKDKQNADKGFQRYTDSEFSEFIERD
jgi:DnaD/phage-associated family protein